MRDVKSIITDIIEYSMKIKELTAELHDTYNAEVYACDPTDGNFYFENSVWENTIGLHLDSDSFFAITEELGIKPQSYGTSNNGDNEHYFAFYENVRLKTFVRHE